MGAPAVKRACAKVLAKLSASPCGLVRAELTRALHSALRPCLDEALELLEGTGQVTAEQAGREGQGTRWKAK